MIGESRAFRVARNPDTDTKLPYLLLLPLEDALVLKARESWPVTARVYCHRFEEPWPQAAEIVEQTPVLLCRRRGAAIALVLDRPRLARSQFVFTQVKGREAIFWQTQKTARAANPGGRIPRRRSLAHAVTIAVDTRERYPYRFAQQGAETVRATVPAGDYAIHSPDGSVLAAVERKSLENLAATLSDGTLAFQLQRLAELPLAAVVVEASYSSLFKLEHVNGSWLADQLARLEVRYPEVHCCSPTPAASPKSGPTASSPQRSPTRPAKPDRLTPLTPSTAFSVWPGTGPNRSFRPVQDRG
jgi:ERCC4 domain-containing protein